MVTSRNSRSFMVVLGVALTVSSFSGLGTGAASAAPEPGATESARQAAVTHAVEYVQEHPSRTGFGPGQALKVRDVILDVDGAEHVRFDRTYRGLAVVGGDFVLHLSGSGALLGIDRASVARVALAGVRPVLSAGGAGAVAQTVSAAVEPRVSSSQLVVDARTAPALAWDVLVEGEKADQTPSRLHVIVDARSGAVRGSWDGVNTESGVGNGFFNGVVELTTTAGSSGFELRDASRGGQFTVDKNNTGRFGGTETLFTDPDNIWGDGTLANRQTSAVDAQYGAAQTWDYFLNIHARNGIANDGVGARSRVHYGNNYNNAFWSDGCFCMTYGDGDGVSYNPFDSLDVAGHEMAHGVTSRTADLIYAGESGGLNEATSDIFGSMVEFYANNPKDRPDYYIGEKLIKGAPSALRAMHKPSLDGNSPDCYSPTIGTLDVHYSSGVANHFYYLLAEGSAATPASPTCNGSTVVGIGRAAAEKIWYRALTTYMTSTTQYKQARVATLKAARDLFGNPSPELSAVNNAWAAVSVN